MIGRVLNLSKNLVERGSLDHRGALVLQINQFSIRRGFGKTSASVILVLILYTGSLNQVAQGRVVLQVALHTGFLIPDNGPQLIERVLLLGKQILQVFNGLLLNRALQLWYLRASFTYN